MDLQLCAPHINTMRASYLCVLLALVAVFHAASASKIAVAAFSSHTCMGNPTISPALATSGACQFSTDFNSYYQVTDGGSKKVEYLFGCALENCTKCAQNGSATFGACVPLVLEGVWASAWLVADNSLTAGIYLDANCSTLLPGAKKSVKSGDCISAPVDNSTTYAAISDLSTDSKYLYEMACNKGCMGCAEYGVAILGKCEPFQATGFFLKVTVDSDDSWPIWEWAVIIAGGVAAVLVVVLIVIIVIVVVMRRSRSDYHPVN